MSLSLLYLASPVRPDGRRADRRRTLPAAPPATGRQRTPAADRARQGGHHPAACTLVRRGPDRSRILTVGVQRSAGQHDARGSRGVPGCRAWVMSAACGSAGITSTLRHLAEPRSSQVLGVLQSRTQKRHSELSFGRLSAREFDWTRNHYSADVRVRADVCVFAARTGPAAHKREISHGPGRAPPSSVLPVAQAARVTAFPGRGQVFKGGEGRSVVPGQPGPDSSRFRRSPARPADLSGAVAGSELVCGSPVAVLCCCTGVLNRGIGRSILWL